MDPAMRKYRGIFFLCLCWTMLLWGAASCNTHSMQYSHLPGTPLPENCLLMYEKTGLNPTDSRGNFRFYIDQEGKYYWMGNRTDEPGDGKSYWDAGFPYTPVRQISPGGVVSLITAINRADFPHLQRLYKDPDLSAESHPSVECWTVVLEGGTQSVIVEMSQRPAEIKELQTALNIVVAEADFVK